MNIFEDRAVCCYDRAVWLLARAYALMEGAPMLMLEQRIASDNAGAAVRRLKSAQFNINAAQGYLQTLMSGIMDVWPHPIPEPEEGVVYGDF